jgi:aminoglycoside 3-N-acetyltransferase I
MSLSVPVSIRQLASCDVAQMEAMLTIFGEAFDDVETYGAARPSRAYLEHLLGSDHFIALAALKNGSVVGGIAAYELQKFEQERSEIYIYDLAVARTHRREGIATALIQELKKIAAARAAYVTSCRRTAAMHPPSRSTRSWESAKTCCTSISP